MLHNIKLDTWFRFIRNTYDIACNSSSLFFLKFLTVIFNGFFILFLYAAGKFRLIKHRSNNIIIRTNKNNHNRPIIYSTNNCVRHVYNNFEFHL